LKRITKEELKNLIETARGYLKENPLKGWAYIHSKHLSDEEVALLQAIWPTLETWKLDSKLLQEGAEKFEFRIEKQLNEVRREELRKLCEELFR